MIKVCLDTNVFVSALLFGGKSEEILNLAAKDEIILITSPQILAELARVLKEKFSWFENDIRRQIRALSGISVIVTPRKRVDKIPHQPDNRVLECAIAGKVDFIVTGDKKHLLPLKSFDGVQIISPGEFLRKIDFKVS